MWNWEQIQMEGRKDAGSDVCGNGIVMMRWDEVGRDEMREWENKTKENEKNRSFWSFLFFFLVESEVRASEVEMKSEVGVNEELGYF